MKVNGQKVMRVATARTMEQCELRCNVVQNFSEASVLIVRSFHEVIEWWIMSERCCGELMIS